MWSLIQCDCHPYKKGRRDTKPDTQKRIPGEDADTQRGKGM